jgi:hypothetical protein
MLQLERNRPIDTEVLGEFFTRCGWNAPAGTTVLEWAMAAADEWVACTLDGQLVGFARACRLGPSHRVVFDALVDPRFRDTGLRSVIVRLLAATAGDLERVSVFGEKREETSTVPYVAMGHYGPLYIPTAEANAYLGRRRS